MPAKRATYYDKVGEGRRGMFITVTSLSQTEPVQNRLYMSLKVWSLYADLEESLGTFEVSHVMVM